VTEFVGYLAGQGAGGAALGLAAAAMTLWVTFAPCFLWIFAGAPWLAAISARPQLTGALSAITAAVVGVILNLSLWFALHVFFGSVREVAIGPALLTLPDPATLDLRAAALAALAAAMLFGLHRGMILTLAVTAAAGLALAAL
jgi:chromate transporter